MNESIDNRLDRIGVSAREFGDTVCDGCKGQIGLRYDATCYQTCDKFGEELAEAEAETEKEQP